MRNSPLDIDEVRASWRESSPLKKLAAFKRLNGRDALDFFITLPFDEKYFLYCGFPLESIAPLLESLPAGRRGAFQAWPATFSDEMLQAMESKVKP